MPYKCIQQGGKWKCVSESGKVHGTHDNKADCTMQLKALYANANPKDEK